MPSTSSEGVLTIKKHEGVKCHASNSNGHNLLGPVWEGMEEEVGLYRAMVEELRAARG